MARTDLPQFTAALADIEKFSLPDNEAHSRQMMEDVADMGAKIPENHWPDPYASRINREERRDSAIHEKLDRILELLTSANLRI